MIATSELVEHTGIVEEILSPTEFVMNCSCWLCDEYGTVHFKQPHGLELKPGDWIRVLAGPIYNYRRVYGTGNYTYVWEEDAERAEQTSRIEEIRSCEKTGETDCGWYDTLLHDEYPDVVQNHRGFDEIRLALKAHRESLIAGEREGAERSEKMVASSQSYDLAS